MVWDSAWEEIHKVEDLGRYPSEHLIRFIRRSFSEIPNKDLKISALEIGCGQGAQVALLAREGFAVVGIDGSPAAISKAERFLKQQKLRAQLFVSDVANLDFPDESFDLVVDVECLMGCTVASSKKIVNECWRVLKPGGLFFSQTFADDTTIGDSFEVVEKNTYRNIVGGHLARKRLLRLTSKDDIEILYSPFSHIEVDKASFSSKGGELFSSEWLIVARKLPNA